MTTSLAKKEAPRHTFKIIEHDWQLDEYRRYLTDSPTPAKFASMMKDIDDGDLAASVELAEEMEAKDQHLQGVMNTRRQAVTALPWHIDPDPMAHDQEAAKVSAKYCEQRLRRIKSWPRTLKHIATGISNGIAVTELLWRRATGELVGTNDVPGDRLCRPWGERDVHVATSVSEQIKASQPKFAVYQPQARAGGGLRVTLMRANAYAWVIKHFLIADWAAFCEVFGMPLRVGYVEHGANDDTRKELRDMLKNLSHDTYGIFDKDSVQIDFLKGDTGTPPFEKFAEWIERKQSILALGQTLTTEHGSVGSLALGQVHDNVRASILFDDIENESEFIRCDILTPMVRMRFPDTPDMPVPHWTRKTFEAKNIEADRLRLDQFKEAQAAGLRVKRSQVYEACGFEEPEEGDTDVIDFGREVRDDARGPTGNPDPTTA